MPSRPGLRKPTGDLSIDDLGGVLLDLQFGVDFPVYRQNFKMGPWVGCALGAFFTRTYGIPDQGLVSGGLDSLGLHAWLSAGIRIAVGF